MPNVIDELRTRLLDPSRSPWLAYFGIPLICLALGTFCRWAITAIRPDMPFSLYFPAVLLAAIFGGLRSGLLTMITGAALGILVHFASAPRGPAQLILLVIYLTISALIIWGIEHYRTTVTRYRELSERLAQEESYRKLVVEELQHRLKNKISTVQAVVRQVLHEHPELSRKIDGQIQALAATDNLITTADRGGCDIKELLTSELGPYGHVRFTLIGDPLFLPARLAVSLALAFHELATNAAKHGAFSSPKGMLHVSWTHDHDELTIVWDETEGPLLEPAGPPGFGTRLLQAALGPFNGKAEMLYLSTGLRCTMRCVVPAA